MEEKVAPIVIVGSGQAGITVARELRKLSADIPITLISADAGGYYAKPSLSNALAAGKSAAQLMITAADKVAEQNRITVLPHCRVQAIEPGVDMLDTNLGKKPYRALVLATGARAIIPPLEGDGAAEVHTANSLEEYAAFRARLAPGMRVAILGAGLIGCEFANDLAASGHLVDVFDLAPQPLGRLLPAQAAAYLEQQLTAIGVTFHFNTRVPQISKAGAGYLLHSDSGSEHAADLVLCAIGLSPDTTLAKAAGLTVNRGIVVNRHLQTSHPNIYALGDAAEVDGWVLPFIQPIMLSARALAQTLAGTPTAVAYPAMPVQVKTPACPTIVSPPAPGAAGSWQEKIATDGVQAEFRSAEGKLLGFALLGSAITQKQALTTELPPLF